jgi:hypothetical protein
MRYLRQLGTNKAPFPWTARKAARKDMVEYDPDQAKVRIEALRRKLDDLTAQPKETAPLDEELIGDAKEIAELEAKIKKAEDAKAGLLVDEKAEKSQEELDMEERQVIINKDSDIIKVRAMRKLDSIRSYLEENYGVTLGEDADMEALKAEAIKQRTARIFEKK